MPVFFPLVMKIGSNKERIRFVSLEYPLSRKYPGQVGGSGRVQSSRGDIYGGIYDTW